IECLLRLRQEGPPNSGLAGVACFPASFCPFPSPRLPRLTLLESVFLLSPRPTAGEMESSELIRKGSAQAELLRGGPAPLRGTLCFKGHHLLPSPGRQGTTDLWLLLLHRVDSIERRAASDSDTRLRCKDLRVLQLNTEGVEATRDIARSIEVLSSLESVIASYPFFYCPKCLRLGDAWHFYPPKCYYKRLSWAVRDDALERSVRLSRRPLPCAQLPPPRSPQNHEPHSSPVSAAKATGPFSQLAGPIRCRPILPSPTPTPPCLSQVSVCKLPGTAFWLVPDADRLSLLSQPSTRPWSLSILPQATRTRVRGLCCYIPAPEAALRRGGRGGGAAAAVLAGARLCWLGSLCGQGLRRGHALSPERQTGLFAWRRTESKEAYPGWRRLHGLPDRNMDSSLVRLRSPRPAPPPTGDLAACAAQSPEPHAGVQDAGLWACFCAGPIHVSIQR
ncbi:LOW QUALITY PROTEIN: myotubularin-related protein 9-like, partial [Rhynchonycteris naso]